MRRICLIFLVSLSLLSCESGPTDNGDTLSTLDAPTGLSESYILIIDTFQFVAAEDGVAPGFNLDGVISGDDDEATCRKEDLLSPDGEEGIDNQLAKVVPLFDVIGVGGALDYTQNSIEEGGVLIMSHPTPWEFHPVHHPSYIDFFEQLLAETTDPIELEQKYEKQLDDEDSSVALLGLTSGELRTYVMLNFDFSAGYVALRNLVSQYLQKKGLLR